MPPIPQLEKAAQSLPMEPSLCATTEDVVATTHLWTTARRTRRSPSLAPRRGGGALSLLATLATLIILAVPAPAVAAAGTCLDGFAAMAIGNATESNARLADRNGDRTACRLTVQNRDGTRSTVLLDNFIGDPSIYPVAACTAPFRAVVIGDPDDLPAAVQRVASAIDANRDGTLCVYIGDPELLVVLDNPNFIGDPGI
jgi:hypothetical protein